MIGDCNGIIRIILMLFLSLQYDGANMFILKYLQSANFFDFQCCYQVDSQTSNLWCLTLLREHLLKTHWKARKERGPRC